MTIYNYNNHSAISDKSIAFMTKPKKGANSFQSNCDKL